ncbi:MAG: hypothetical protein QNJ74_24820 [Trichodesmium sp. MO_231.B1]|nr:hypothetical protein [Trichodesmium sp. MO_231.B1]
MKLQQKSTVEEFFHIPTPLVPILSKFLQAIAIHTHNPNIHSLKLLKKSAAERMFALHFPKNSDTIYL